MIAGITADGTIVMTRYETTREDGYSLKLRWYTRPGGANGPAVIYIHGGGMISGSLDIYDPLIRQYVASTGVPMLAAEYRLAPENPHPVPVEDNFSALSWLIGQADKLGVDSRRIAVMGDSAGGGIAAGVALLARERGVALARQILVYPMLDDRHLQPDPLLAPFAIWSYDANYTGWKALLGDSVGSDHVSAIAAPARCAELAISAINSRAKFLANL